MSRYLLHDPTFRVLFPHLAASDLHERGEALLLLLADRSIPRIVCAPPLYGKSVLALQYAQIMFEDDRVLWINAADPRFLRDLDAGALVAYLSDETKLLVIDEVAALSSERKRAFDLLLSSVCAAGCEVVATTGDITLAASLEACIEITAADLQMTPDEFPSSLAAPAAPALEARLGPPVVLLDRPQGRTRFVAQLAARTPASNLERIALAALLLGRGPVRLLDPLAAVEVHAVAPEITRRFPYAGIHSSHARFEAFPLTEAERCRLAHRHAACLAAAGHFIDEASFLEALCDALEAIGDETAVVLLRSEAGEGNPAAKPSCDPETEPASALSDPENGESAVLAPAASVLLSPSEGVPLDIRLFGRFEMTCDGRLVPPTGSLRRKAKILVALLTVNHNKELPRSWIEAAMWPGVSQAKARSSFYNLWSYLCRALEPHDAGAIATFLGCRRALIDRFGIDASRRLDALYRQIIEEMGTGS